MGMCVLPLTDDNGNDVVMIWGQLLRDAKPMNFKSKKSGKDMSKTNLYLRHGTRDEDVISADAWFGLGEVCATAKKGDYFFGIGIIEEDTYNNQTQMMFTTGGGSMRYGYVTVARRPRQKEAEPFKEAKLPTDVFADIQQDKLPF